MNKARFLTFFISISLSVGIFSAEVSAEYLPKNFLQALHQDYLSLKQRLPQASSKEIKAFLQRYPNTPFTKQLRKLWLIQLAQQKKWAEYQAFYKSGEDTSLNCYNLLAKHNMRPKENILSAVLPLWQVGTSQPPACNELFEQLIKQHILQDSHVLQRFQLAIAEKNIPLAQQLTKQLSSKDKQRIAHIWLTVYKNPKQLDKILVLPKYWQQQIIAQVIQKIALKDTNRAYQLWQQYSKEYPFNDEERYAIYRIFSLEYAFDGNITESDRWSQKLPANQIDATLREWQIRAAMLKQDWQQVKNHIEQLPEIERKTPQWQYWLARALDKLNHRQAAFAIYKSLGKEKNYYSFLADFQLKKPIKFVPSKPIITSSTKLQNAVSNEDLTYLKQIYQQGSHTDARLLLRTLLPTLSELEKHALAQQVASWNWYQQAIAIIEDTDRATYYTDSMQIRFPIAYVDIVKQVSTQFKLSPPLIYAIMRQESTFQHDAKSTADAMGLMQILPKNAHTLAPNLKIHLKSPYDLLRPENNIRLGGAYLSYLDKHLKQHFTLMASAYNVGITNILKRQKNYPDIVEMDLWIETMPWKETRHYLRNVLTYFVIYQYRLGQPLTVEPFMKKIG